VFLVLTALILGLGEFMSLNAQVSRDWYVPDDYLTIQDAIDGVANGDRIFVRDGIYTENINFNGKRVKLKSENGSANCVIDGSGSGTVVAFANGETSSTRINGFTIRNGNAMYGGGISCTLISSPTIINNVITANSAYTGGGIYCESSSPLIENNVISANDNGAGNSAGGGIALWNSSSIIDGNTIIENIANRGGGIAVLDWADPHILNNYIGTTSELIQGCGNSSYYGGGIFCTGASSPEIGGDNYIYYNDTCAA